MKRDVGGDRDRGGPIGPGAPIPQTGPVAPWTPTGPGANPLANAAAPSGAAQARGAAPRGPAAPPELPEQASPVAKAAVAAPPPSQVAAPGNRPGTQAAQQALAARAGVRIGAFDPRQRGQDDQGRAIAAILGVQPGSISAAQASTPPSLGFNPAQFTDEQAILGALRG